MKQPLLFIALAVVVGLGALSNYFASRKPAAEASQRCNGLDVGVDGAGHIHLTNHSNTSFGDLKVYVASVERLYGQDTPQTFRTTLDGIDETTDVDLTDLLRRTNDGARWSTNTMKMTSAVVDAGKVTPGLIAKVFSEIAARPCESSYSPPSSPRRRTSTVTYWQEGR